MHRYGSGTIKVADCIEGIVNMVSRNTKFKGGERNRIGR